MSTKSNSKEAANAARGWRVVDATGLPIGRLASRVASVIRGKDKPYFSPHTDCGDFVIVLNAQNVVLTGNKGETKMYRHHTGFLGGLKEVKGAEMLRTNPEKAIRLAVQGMLPKGPLGRRMITKLKVYQGSEHEHAAQRPEPLSITTKRDN